jgi:hypothetical protein
VKFARAAASEVIGLFVGEWSQTLVSIAILGAGWFLLSRVKADGLAYVIALALAAQLVYATRAEARRTVQGNRR